MPVLIVHKGTHPIAGVLEHDDGGLQQRELLISRFWPALSSSLKSPHTHPASVLNKKKNNKSQCIIDGEKERHCRGRRTQRCTRLLSDHMCTKRKIIPRL